MDESSLPIEQDEADMIEQSKREYASFIAHELRSPLTAIQGYAELIALAGQVNPTQEQFIRQIHAGVEKINKLIGEISRETGTPKYRQALKIASAGAVRENPAEAFAKGGNSDEHQESILSPVIIIMIQENLFPGHCQKSPVNQDDAP